MGHAPNEFETVSLSAAMPRFSTTGLAATLTALHYTLSKGAPAITVVRLQEMLAMPAACQVFVQVTMTNDRTRCITGFACYVRRPLTATALLDPIVVQRDRRRIMGHGTPLLQQSLALVWEAWPDIRYVDLTTSNARLVDFYKRFGFRKRLTLPMRLQRPE